MLNKYFHLLILIFAFTVNAQIRNENTTSDSIPKYAQLTIPELWSQIEDIFNDPSFNGAEWGVVIQSLANGEYFYKKNEDKLFTPASNLKILTTAAALFLLGEDYTYSTDVFYRGEIDGSILEGDLIIQGRGDPTLSARFHDGDMTAVFSNWADSLLRNGIDEIKGNIIGDDNYFDDIGLAPGWSWENESYWYSAPTSALSFNDNCVDLIIQPNRNKKTVDINILPDIKYVVILNNVEVLDDDSKASIDVYRERGTNVINVFGHIGAYADSFKTFVSVNNPTQFSVVTFKDVLKKKGIKVSGYPVDIDDISSPIDYSKANFLFSYHSPELKDIVKVINKNSYNLYAELLLKTIGLEIEGFGSTANGIKAEKTFLNEIGINPESIRLVDGSGLSRLNLISPRNIVAVLDYIYKSPYFIPFYNSLPIAGTDGTLGKRMTYSQTRNNVRAKTGYLEGVRSLSGYVYTGDKEPVAFSMIVNNYLVPDKLAENIQDLICLRLANFKRK